MDGRPSRTCLAIGFLLLTASLVPVAGQRATTAQPQALTCAPVVDGLRFICGIVDPEDIVQIPGSRWLVISGYDPGGGLLGGSGLKLVDTRAKSFSVLYTATGGGVRRDARSSTACADPPPAGLVTHGLYLGKTSVSGQYMLYAVTHAPRETVEMFSLNATADVPQIAWSGCLPMPAGFRGNGVATFSDGTVLVTVPNAPDRRGPDGAGRGVVLEWKPGSTGFRPVPGTELASNNGIEISKDEKEFFVVAFGEATIYVFSRANPAVPARSVKAPGFVPDNLRWSGDRLIGTGPMYDEPACGGTRREAAAAGVGRGPGGGCNRGYVAAALDPVAMTWKILAYAEPNRQIGIISVGVVVDDTLWIGAALSPGLGYRPLPRPNN